MKRILAMAAAVLGLVGCVHRPTASPDVVRLLWNSDGKPEVGITILPEEEVHTGVPSYFSPQARAQRTSDSSGVVRLDLREYLWSDGKYHFHLFRGEKDLGTETVPKKGFDGVISDLSEYMPHIYEGAGPPNIQKDLDKFAENFQRAVEAAGREPQKLESLGHFLSSLPSGKSELADSFQFDARGEAIVSDGSRVNYEQNFGSCIFGKGGSITTTDYTFSASGHPEKSEIAITATYGNPLDKGGKP